jgi:hypothetical protein
MRQPDAQKCVKNVLFETKCVLRTFFTHFSHIFGPRRVCVGFCTQPLRVVCTQILYGRIAWAIRGFGV